jgi:hypothetical protein
MANRGNRAAIELVKLMDSQEQERLLLFLASPYCTGLPPDNDCYKLMTYVLQNSTAEAVENMDAEKISKAVFPGRNLPKTFFDDLMATLLDFIRKFIHYESKAHDMVGKNATQKILGISLLRFLSGKKAEKRFWSVRQSLAGLQKNRTGWLPTDYYWNYEVEQEETMWLSINNTKKDDLNLLESIRALEEYFILQYMILLCYLYAQNQLTSLGLRHWRETIFFNFNTASAQTFFSKPLGRLFIMALEFTETENSGTPIKDYELYDRLLLSIEEQLPIMVLRNFETIGCNYLTRRYTQGDIFLLGALLKIFKRRVSTGRIYLEDGKIQISHFQNCVTLGLRAGDFDWVRNFLNNNREKISGTEHPEQCYEYNLANYYFHIQDYEKARRPLFQINYEEMQYKISARILQIKFLYETREDDSLFSGIGSARTFFSREKKKETGKASAEKSKEEGDLAQKGNVPELKRVSSLNFINIVEDLATLRLRSDRQGAELLITTIETTDTVAERDWLLEKAREIVDGKR